MVEMFSTLSHVHNKINNEVSWLFIIQLSRTISVSNCKMTKKYIIRFLLLVINFILFHSVHNLLKAAVEGIIQKFLEIRNLYLVISNSHTGRMNIDNYYLTEFAIV